MSLLVFDLLAAVMTAVVSVSLGYWLRGRALAMFASRSQAAAQEQKLAQEALARMHDLASAVAADVGAHSDQVQKINTELNEGDQTTDSVLTAMAKLIKANERMQQKLDSAEHQIEEQARKMQSYEAEARTDALTGIANRRALDDFTRRQHGEFQRHGRPVTVMMLDVDRFKNFNDRFGHQAGDEVLKGVARVLTETMRDVDLVARYGGEEFAVVFPGEQVGDCGIAAERARAAIEDAVFYHDGCDLKVTVSFGLAELRRGETMAQTLRRADEALYASKEAGRNCAHWHDGEASYPISHQLAEQPPAGPAQPLADEPLAEPSPEEAVVEPSPAADAHAGEDEARSNRASFLSDVARRVAEFNRTGSPLSVILVGIDDLDALARRHGEAGRQMVVQAATQFLHATMRDMDHVAQVDKDAFGLLLPTADWRAAERIAERLRQAISKCALPVGSAHLRFTVSLGVAETRAGDDAARLFKRAEQALTGARAQGGNRALIHRGREVVAAERPVAVVGG